MIEKLVFAVKNILNYLNKKKINRLGLNTQLFCRIEKRHPRSKINIGSGSLINGKLVTETEKSIIDIKDNVFIGGNTIIDCKDEIIIENDVLVSYECVIFDHDSHSTKSSLRKNDLSKFKNMDLNWDQVDSKKIHIKKNAWICARSMIMKGTIIGQGSIVAAGSVVTNDVPDYTLVGGNPAKFIKKVD